MKDYLHKLWINVLWTVITFSILATFYILKYWRTTECYLKPQYDIEPIPTLTGEYWQPDWWETLTWPYLDVQTMQIQELQKENDRLKEAYRSVESKLQKEKRCWDLECWTIVWFIDWHAISFWRVIFYADEEIKEGEIWWYEIQTEEQYHSKEYYWFERILPKSDTYRSKEELLKHIKGM